MREDKNQCSLTNEPTTIIHIPSHTDTLKGKPLTVKVKWESSEPAYFVKYNDDYSRVSSQDLLDAINARLRLPQFAWLILLFGLLTSMVVAQLVNKEVAIIYLIAGFFLTCLMTVIIFTTERKRRKITIHFEQSEESQLAFTKLAAALEKIRKVSQVWDISSGKRLTIESTALPKIGCNIPSISFTGIQPKIFWLPDRLYILAGRVYQTYSYKQLSIETSSYHTEQRGKLPTDTQIVSQRWLHQRKDGQADKRYQENYLIPTVEYGALHFNTPAGTPFKLGISNCAAVNQIADAFRTLAQSKPPVSTQNVETPSSTHQPAQPPPTVSPQQHSPLLVPQAKAKDVIYPLTGSHKEVIYPLTTLRETKEKGVIHNDSKQFLQDALKYHSREGTPCEMPSLKTYEPTYASLNEQQMQWYFYWRMEVRKGNYLPTHTSYLFLYAYEVLNLVEKKEPLAAAQYLRRLIPIYSKNNELILPLFTEWVGDLVAENLDLDKALDFRVWSQEADLIDVMIHRAIRSNELTKTPSGIWYQLADYHLNNKQLTASFSMEHITDAHIRAIALASVYSQKKTGKSIIEHFITGEPREIHRQLFRSAIIGRNYQTSISLGFAYTYVGNKELAKYLGAVMKEAENVLLLRAGITSQLWATDLPLELKDILGKFLPNTLHPNDSSAATAPTKEKPTSGKQAPVQSRIKIDLSRVEELQRESEKISELLSEKNGQVQEYKPFRPLGETTQTNRKENIVTPRPTQPSSLLTKPLLEIDLARVKELQLESEEIIELLAVEDERPEQLFNEEPKATTQSETLPDEADVNDEWRKLLTQITSAEKELLTELAKSGRLAETQIDTIAHKYKVMALIDGLSEKAYEFFERDLIFSEGNQWIMEDDDLEILRLRLNEMEQA